MKKKMKTPPQKNQWPTKQYTEDERLSNTTPFRTWVKSATPAELAVHAPLMIPVVLVN